jgi:hypothetical protein
MEILFDDNLKDIEPDNNSYFHLLILCLSLKFCLGQSKAMSYVKLSYLFDVAIKREFSSSSNNKLIEPWDVEGYFRITFLLANSLELIEASAGAKGLAISLTTEGDEYIMPALNDGAFSEYVNFLKSLKLTEKDFLGPTIKCEFNEY